MFIVCTTLDITEQEGYLAQSQTFSRTGLRLERFDRRLVLAVGSTELLRADVRVIAAADPDLQGAITPGTFRSDSFIS